MRFCLIIALLAQCAFGIDGLPERKYLLNSYYNPNRLVFRLGRGSFECSMLGVIVPYFSAQNPCNSPKMRVMSHQSIGYMQNVLNLEQLYGVRVVGGYCVVADGNAVLNERIVRDGFGVVSKNGDAAFLERLRALQESAKASRAGLWRDFAPEMECLAR